MDRGNSVYDRITIGLHWLAAGLVVTLYLIGEFVEDLLAKGPAREAVWSVHFVLGFVLAGVIGALALWRHTGGRQLPIEDPGPLHLLAKATHAALYVLLLVVAGLGVANALVRGVSLFGIASLPHLGDPALRRPLTHWHGLAANLLMAVVLFHVTAALVHHYLWQDAVLGRMPPGRSSSEALARR
ncbi:cytochrome b [Methylobacterium nigriterrae]|uniref:cytochrome b n=1 Tax=Methylobacterium nigriterrae TaxID=3127512 RepID=UPI00301333EC